MKNVAVIGSSGAIGEAFVKQYIKDSSISKNYSISRSRIEITDDRVKHIQMDIVDEMSVENAAKAIQEKHLDHIIIATGILHTSTFGPEKSVRDISMNKFVEVLTVNTVGPALVGKFFLPLLNNKSKSVMAFLSARVGSISDNKLGGWYSYRASKSALNQVIKNFSIEIKRTNSHAVIMGLQPGTVKSKLSEPFQKNVKKGNLISAEESVTKLIKVIEECSSAKSGSLLGWDGSIIKP